MTPAARRQNFGNPIPVVQTNDLSSLGVLIVDDDDDIVMWLQHMLGRLGATDVQFANDGRAALDMLDEGLAPDLLTLDLNMPGMDGIEFVRHLSERSARPKLVLISAEEHRVVRTVSDLATAYGLTVLGTLPKPLDRISFESMLASAHDHIVDVEAYGDVEPLSVEALREGLDGSMIEIFFQPKIEVVSGRVGGVEALARWRDEARGLLPASAFIPLAERTGDIEELTLAIFRRSLEQYARWRACGHAFTLSANFSPRSFSELRLPEQIVEALDAQGIEPAEVIIELTESGVLSDLKAGLEIVSRLRMKGLSVAIDDFGTGSATLDRLKRMPFSELKIDRAFVHGASTNPQIRTMLESTVDLGKALDLVIVAEGVEEPADWALVSSLGVDLVQGFFVAPPMDASAFENWLSRRG